MATADDPIEGYSLTHPTSVSQTRSAFDAFLYASVEERDNQPFLSVISALARLDIDPWQEAAKLSHMSRDKAAWRLAALIETLPNDSSAHMDYRTVATRLIALLPRQIVINIPLRDATLPVGIPANIRFFMALILLNAIFMAVFFNHRDTAASHPPPAQAKPVLLSASPGAKPPVPSLQPDNER